MLWRKISMVVVMMVILVVNMVRAFDLTKYNPVYGFKIGTTFSSFWGNGVTDLENSLSQSVDNLDPGLLVFPTLGMFAEFELIPQFLALQPEIFYVRSGKPWELGLSGAPDVAINLYSDYLNIPILLKLLIPFDAPVMPGAYAGPNLFIRLRSRADNVAQVPDTLNRFLDSFGSEKSGDKVAPVDVGLSTGLSIDFLVGRGRIIVDLRYTFGFIDVFTVSSGSDMRNSIFSISAGYGR